MQIYKRSETPLEYEIGLKMETQQNTQQEVESYSLDIYNLKKHTGEKFIPKFLGRFSHLDGLKEKIQANVKKSLEEKQRSIVISFCSEKGGAGKSTSALCIGQLIANLGFSVLLVDTDSTRSSSKVAEARIREINGAIAYADSNHVPVEDVIEYKKGKEPIMDVLGLNQELFNANVVQDLATKKSHDVILIDTAGVKLAEVGNFDVRAISVSGKPHITTAYTSNFVLVPTGTSNLELTTTTSYLHPLMGFITALKVTNKSIVNTQCRVLANRVEREGSGLKELNKAQEEIGGNWFNARIRRSEKVPANTSNKHGDTIFTNNVAAKIIEAYIDVVDQMFDDIAVSLEA